MLLDNTLNSKRLGFAHTFTLPRKKNISFFDCEVGKDRNSAIIYLPRIFWPKKGQVWLRHYSQIIFKSVLLFLRIEIRHCGRRVKDVQYLPRKKLIGLSLCLDLGLSLCLIFFEWKDLWNLFTYDEWKEDLICYTDIYHIRLFVISLLQIYKRSKYLWVWNFGNNNTGNGFVPANNHNILFASL